MLELNRIMEIAGDAKTPMYLFDLDELAGRVKNMKEILGDDITLCYAMKANPFLVNGMRELAAKYEVCSPGEFAICEREKLDMGNIVLSGVNKEEYDIEHVMHEVGGVGIYTIESVNQLELINKCASESAKKANVLLRVTSGNQFGLDEEVIEKIVASRSDYENINIKGIQCYTGTQKKKMSIIEEELKWLDGFCDKLLNEYDFKVEELEYGPGLSVHYFGADAYNNNFDELKELSELLNPLRSKYEITLEMGRYIVATCGVFISQVSDMKCNKGQNYCIIDGGINHINYYGQAMAMKIPAFSFVKKDGTVVNGFDDDLADNEKWTICGSLCTVGDVIVKNLPIGRPEVGDTLCLYNIGAYSVTEGIYLFLSRRLPKVAAYSISTGVQMYRSNMATDVLNSRQYIL